jgi:hypothetical protein
VGPYAFANFCIRYIFLKNYLKYIYFFKKNLKQTAAKRAGAASSVWAQGISIGPDWWMNL